MQQKKEVVEAFKKRYEQYMNKKSDLFLLMNILGEFIEYMYKNSKKNTGKFVTINNIDKLIYDYA